jgi:hypothetical protein
LISCYLFDTVIYLALTNGKIFYLKPKSKDHDIVADRGKDPEVIELLTKKPHKGKVTCLITAELSEKNVLITGSAD